MRIFAVTYTYNDATLVNALLGEIRRWTVRPDAVLVVDDGSATPYAPDAAAPAGGPAPRILRLESNQGPGRAKRAGLAAAADGGADVILSLDADIRPHPDWLATALPRLADPGVGLVGAEFAHGLSADSLSRYLRAFFTPAAEDKAAPFLGAGLWLLRRDVWDNLGGFGDFDRTTHEDLYFCRKIAVAGLAMWSVNSKPVRQIRRLHRCAYVRREMAYLGLAIRKWAETHGLENALRPLAEQASARMGQILEQGAAEFLYLEIFRYTATLAWLGANAPAPADRDTAARDLSAACLGGLAAYPNTLALLHGDLAAIGLPQTRSAITAIPLAASPLPEARRLHPLLLKLEWHGARALAREDRTVPFDTHYLSPPHLSLDGG